MTIARFSYSLVTKHIDCSSTNQLPTETNRKLVLEIKWAGSTDHVAHYEIRVTATPKNYRRRVGGKEAAICERTVHHLEDRHPEACNWNHSINWPDELINGGVIVPLKTRLNQPYSMFTFRVSFPSNS